MVFEVLIWLCRAAGAFGVIGEVGSELVDCGLVALSGRACNMAACWRFEGVELDYCGAQAMQRTSLRA